MAHKTEHNKKALIEAMVKSLGVVTSACKIAGVGRTAFYDYYNHDPEFKAVIDDVTNITLDFAESKLHQQIDNGNITAIIFYLKTKGKNRGYVERQEISGVDGKPLEVDFRTG
jgi:hypothetical protein